MEIEPLRAGLLTANRCRFDGIGCRYLPLAVLDRRILDSGT